MEQGTINLEQTQRIIAASQFFGALRPVSYSNDGINPLLKSGACGLITSMVNGISANKSLAKDIKYSPWGNRSSGVNRAQNYSSNFDKFLQNFSLGQTGWSGLITIKEVTDPPLFLCSESASEITPQSINIDSEVISN
jgi:hypothetical protein